jgi:catechol 2,3-dioxygenase-like lactoylglutathione lyase family enzyme
MHPLRILETCLYADDLAAAEDFYSRILGLDFFARDEGRHVFFKLGDSMLLIFNPADSALQTNLPAHGQQGAGHLAMGAEETELDAWKVHLEEAGVGIERDYLWPQGGRSLYFRDPAGNSVEIVSPRIWGL